MTSDLTPERRAANMRLWEEQRWIPFPPGNLHTYDARIGRYIVAACNDLPLYESALAEAERENMRLRIGLRIIDNTLRVPAAEYVPAIGDVFSIIDRLVKGTP